MNEVTRGRADRNASPPSAPAAESVLSAEVNRVEQVLALGRSTLALVLGMRMVAIGVPDQPGGGTRFAAALAAIAVALVASGVLLLRARRGRLRPIHLYGSVLLDASASFFGLLSNVLAPWPWYEGTLRIPDVAGLLIVVALAGLRMSGPVAAFGAAMGSAAFGALMILDQTRNATMVTYGASEIVLYGIYLATASGLGLVIANRTRTLVGRAADSASRAERARHVLMLVAEEHHDVRSVISSAKLNAARLRAGLRDGEPAHARCVARLDHDLSSVEAFVRAVHERMASEVFSMGASSTANARLAVEQVVSGLARRFPRVSFDIQVGDREQVTFAAGEDGLRRLFGLLLVNACEGDGTRGATHVTIASRLGPSRAACEIVVEDDGPGLPAALAAGETLGAPSSKSYGTGLGLFYARLLVESSGGTITFANHARGARVTFEAPRVDAHDDVA